jgi:hypothetical protein
LGFVIYDTLMDKIELFAKDTWYNYVREPWMNSWVSAWGSLQKPEKNPVTFDELDLARFISWKLILSDFLKINF